MVKGHWTHVSDASDRKRSSHSLSVTGGKAYIYGGELRPREPVDSDVHVIRLTGSDAGSMSTFPSSDSAPIPRVGVVSTALRGKIYVFSGRGGVAMSPIEEKGSLWLFDVAEGAWARMSPRDESSPYPEGRSYHALANDSRDTLFVHAGCPETGRLRDLWSFNLSSRAWKQLAPAPGPARGGPSLAYSDGKLYRINGFDGKTEQGGSLDVYEIAHDSWTTISYRPDGRAGPIARSVSCLLAVTVFGNPTLITMFGESDPSNLGHQGAGKMLDDVWLFDISTSTWTKMALSGLNHPPPRGWFDADVLLSSPLPKIVVHGGLAESNERLGDLWMLELDE